eukprot:jgi/Mesen1/6983/ME000362S06111
MATKASASGVNLSAEDWKTLVTPAFDLYNRAFVQSTEGSDKVPDSALPTLTTIAASIKSSAAGMGPWGMTELTLGLYKLANKHALDGAVDAIDGDVLHWLRWAMAAYESDAATLAINLGGEGGTGYLQGEGEDKSEGEGYLYAHSGMLGSAKWLLETEGATLHQLLHENAGYKLVMAGHSLGAGAACLLSMLFRETRSPASLQSQRLDIPSADISCWGFGCPPCVDSRLAQKADWIRVVVLQDDVVARMCPAAVEALRNEILDTDWTKALPEGSARRKLVEAADASSKFLGGLEEGLGFQRGHLYQKASQLGWSALQGLAKKPPARADAGGAAKAAGGVSTGALLSAAGAFGAAFFSAAVDHAVNEKKKAQGKVQQQGISSTAAASSAPSGSSGPRRLVREAPKEEEEVEEQQQLVVPGVLYQILRQPIPEGQVPPRSIAELMEIERREIAEWQRQQEEEGGGGRTELEFWLQPEQDGAKQQGMANGDADKEAGLLGSLIAWGKSKSRSLPRAESDGEAAKAAEDAAESGAAGAGAGAAGGGGGNGGGKPKSWWATMSFKDIGAGGAAPATLNAAGPPSAASPAADGAMQRGGSQKLQDCEENAPGTAAQFEGAVAQNAGGGLAAAAAAAVEAEKAASGQRTAEMAEQKARAEKKFDAMAVRHVVVRQRHPESRRFGRIVISSTMLSDHNCLPCGEGIINAMQWCAA